MKNSYQTACEWGFHVNGEPVRYDGYLTEADALEGANRIREQGYDDIVGPYPIVDGVAVEDWS